MKIENEEYVLQMKKFILDTLNELFTENILDDQVKWEYLKYNIRNYTIRFSKELAKNKNKTIADLETNLKHYEKLGSYVDNIDYKVCKQQLDEICMSLVKNPLNLFQIWKNIVQCKVKYILSLLTKMILQIKIK